jgi:hypothetical protein
MFAPKPVSLVTSNEEYQRCGQNRHKRPDNNSTTETSSMLLNSRNLDIGQAHLTERMLNEPPQKKAKSDERNYLRRKKWNAF